MVEKIVITKEDLEKETIKSGTTKTYPTVKEYPKVEYTPDAIYSGKKQQIFSSKNIMQYIIAGLIGGFIAWMVTEIFWSEHRNVSSNVLVDMALWGGVMTALIGGCIASSEGIVTQSSEKAIKDGVIGLGIGFIGGFFGGFFGQTLYSFLGGGKVKSIGLQIFARTIGWGLLGAFVGIAQGIVVKSLKKMMNATIGGLIGGLVGGFLFDPIGIIIGGGTISRIVAIPVLGTTIGYAISMVEELSKSAWIQIIKGPMTGKQFILYKPETSIGSSPKNDIPILKDSGIAPKHAVIKRTGNTSIIMSVFNQPVAVNGSFVPSRRLSNNDQIQLGNTVLLYSEKVITEKKSGYG